MKVIIIDGPDNTGKNTIIHDILEHNDSVKVIHCHKPENSADDPLREMRKVYFYHTDTLCEDMKHRTADVVVFNRYYIGEWVYGQMYRDESPIDIWILIQEIEHCLITNIGRDNIYYIQLLSSSPELLMRNDDGRSLSNGEFDKISKELSMFKKAYGFSRLNKKIIYINEGDRFRPKQDIIKEVHQFIS